MAVESVAAALELEHREIDLGIEAFTSGLAAGEVRPEPILRAIHALRRHIYLEEAFLFPPLRGTGLMAPVFVMLREHGQIWKTMDALEREVTTGTVDASTIKVCRRLMVELQHHNLKEEKILYPEAERVLTATANAELAELLESAKMPEGWVCERANS